GRDQIDSPIGLRIDVDARDPQRNVLVFAQSGLGLPDRDSYFDTSPAGLELRTAYGRHIEQLLALGGATDPKGRAARVLEVEQALAEIHWNKIENRDPEKTYNPHSRADLRAKGPLVDSFLHASGLSHVDRVIVEQPSYLEAALRLFE